MLASARMDGIITPQPQAKHDDRFPPLETVIHALASSYGIEGRYHALPSEKDLNFRCTRPDGTNVIVKVVRACRADQPALARDVGKIGEDGTSELELDFHESLLHTLQKNEPEIPVPRTFRAHDGSSRCKIHDARGHAFWLRVLSYLPGRPIGDIRPALQTYESLGRLLGRFDRGLRSFGHPGSFIDLHWDLRHTTRCWHRISHIDDELDRERVEGLLKRFDARILPRLHIFRAGVIHNDASDWNVLIDDSQSVCGLIDLGDAMHTIVVAEVAIACAYAIIKDDSPLRAAGQIVAAYHREYPLEDVEVESLYDLIAARLCISVTMAASRRDEAIDNPYLRASEESVWHLLRRWSEISPTLATAYFRRCVGLPATPHSSRFQTWLDRANHLHPVFDPPVRRVQCSTLNWSQCDDPLVQATTRRDQKVLEILWHEERAKHGSRYMFGEWGELRSVYASAAYDSKLVTGSKRSIHLGLDVFADQGTKIYAPLDATVVETKIFDQALDYGGCVVLAHEPESGLVFRTLWGHLSHASVNRLHVGQKLCAGEQIGELGDFRENGQWIPHLHVQVLLPETDEPSSLPGVGEPEFFELWREIFPDPSLLVGRRQSQDLAIEDHASSLLQRRRKVFSPTLSLSYDDPLLFVRGSGVWLYDESGRTYLDAFNNVAHLGHCHPRVVEAIARQSAIHNTNTRYLHPLVVRYVERLVATMPKHLSVATLTCTGSEANDLALRMARTITGRKDVLVLDWAYHGNTQAVLEVSPYKYKRRGGAGRAEWIHELPLPDLFRPSHPGQPGSTVDAHELTRIYAQDARARVAEMVAQGRPPAAIIVEAIPTCAGQVILPSGYLQSIFAAVREAGGLCIVDEVQIGFGRVGSHMWAFEEHGVLPDIVTLGKPMGNGHPLAGLVTTSEIAHRFDNGMEYFNTFAANPVACAAGLAVLDTLRDENLLQNARDRGDQLFAALRKLANDYPGVGEVRGRGLFIGLDMVKNRVSKEPDPAIAQRIVARCKDEGLLLGTDGPLGNVIKVRPPMIFSSENVYETLEILEKALKAERV
jgi:4-aminobutyrate aminotransferase-like enzyme/Ser/Thr protein kinase RdoA (MazF antagonist)